MISVTLIMNKSKIKGIPIKEKNVKIKGTYGMILSKLTV